MSEQYAVVNAEGLICSQHATEELAREYVRVWNAACGPYTVARVVLEPIPDPPPNPGERRVWFKRYNDGHEQLTYHSKPTGGKGAYAGTLWSAVIPADAWELVEG